jgi:hypothetical protein
MGTPRARWERAPISKISGADLSGAEGKGYKTDTDGTVILATAAAVDGVIIDGGNASGDAVLLAPAGCGLLVEVLPGGNINENDELTTDASALFIATTTSTDKIAGQATTNGSTSSTCMAIMSGAERRYQ